MRLKTNKRNHLHHQKRSKDEKELLRGKNRELIKEVKRLKRLKARTPEQSDEWTSHSDVVMEDSPKGAKLQCPKCSSEDVNTLELRHTIYAFCRECDHRWKPN